MKTSVNRFKIVLIAGSIESHCERGVENIKDERYQVGEENARGCSDRVSVVRREG